MKARHLESAHVEDNFLGPIKDEDHEAERDEHLRVYTVPDGKRIRIRPILPESWHSLETYLTGVGCPPDVAGAIKAGVERIGGKVAADHLSARLRDEDSLDVFLTWDSGRVLQLVLSFEDTEAADS